MKHNKLKENALFDYKKGLLKGDLYKKEPLFNATALYYTLLTDIIQASFIKSLNRDLAGFMLSVRDLISASIPILRHNKGVKIADYKEKLKNLYARQRAVYKLNMAVREEQTEFILQELTDVRERILYHLSPVLMATKMSLNPEEKLDDALGLK